MSQLTVAELRPTAEPVLRTILGHPDFPMLVREVAVHEASGDGRPARLRLNSPTYGFWMTRGEPRRRKGQPHERAWLFARRIGEVVEREHGLTEPESLAYVVARDHSRCRLDGRPDSE